MYFSFILWLIVAFIALFIKNDSPITKSDTVVYICIINATINYVGYYIEKAIKNE